MSYNLLPSLQTLSNCAYKTFFFLIVCIVYTHLYNSHDSFIYFFIISIFSLYLNFLNINIRRKLLFFSLIILFCETV